MKHVLFATMMALSVSAGAQISLEKSYFGIGTVTVHNLEGEGFKYMVTNSTSNKLDFYNANHSFWKAINLSIPAGHVLITASYPSTKLFDTDNGVEVVITYYESGSNPINYTTQIINEDGSLLKQFNSAGSLGVTKVGNDWKAIVLLYLTPAYSEVYSLPGQYLGLQKPGKGGNDTDTELYPNPMQSAATLHYALPTGVHSGVIDVYNTAGTKMRSYQITDHYNDIIVHRGDLPSGVYYYNVTTTAGTSAAQKFVIQ